MIYKAVQLGKSHLVVESGTELILKTFDKKRPAAKLAKILNVGNIAFEGNTPPFFCREVTKHKEGNTYDCTF